MPQSTQSIFATINLNLEFEQFEKNRVLHQQLKIEDASIQPNATIHFDTADYSGFLGYQQIGNQLTALIIQLKTNSEGVRICIDSQLPEIQKVVCIETDSKRKEKDYKWISTKSQYPILPLTDARIIVLGFNKALSKVVESQNSNLAFGYSGFKHFAQVFELNSTIFLYRAKLQSQIYALANHVLKSLKIAAEDSIKVSENDQKNLMILEKNEVRKDDFSNHSYSIEELASMTSMCPTKFKKAFKLLFNETPHQYFLNYKMDLAQKLLLSKKLTIAQIASRVGYQSMGRFSTAFVARFGILPSKI